MILNFFMLFFRFLFFKVFPKYKLSDFILIVNFLIGFFALFLGFLIFIFVYKISNIVFSFFMFYIVIFKNWMIKHFLFFFLDLLFFVHRIRFSFFLGTSYYDPLVKIFSDKFAIMKGEMLMDFYNFGNKFIFENSYNIPLSIFSRTPFFESGRTFHLVKNFYNLHTDMFQFQNRSRTFFYFKFKNKFLVQENFIKINTISDSFMPKSFFDNLFVNFLFTIMLFLFNSCSLDFFLFLTRIETILLNNSMFSFFRLFLSKYFSFLRSCFTFLVVNLEYDAFFNYLYVVLYKMAVKNFYNKNDWNNLFNTYNLNSSNFSIFDGFKKDDFFVILKITFIYLFIYLNYFIFLIFSVLVLIFKIFFFYCGVFF